MYLKKIFFIIIFILPSLCFTQNLERKDQFFFNIGPEFRITPIYKLNEPSLKSFFTEVDAQNSGFAINLGVDYYITNRLSIGFIYSIRYDIVTREDIQTDSALGISSVDKRILLGYHFELKYNFKVFKKGDLHFGVGLALLNRNSEFNITEPLFDQNGVQVGTTSSVNDYKYGANKIFLGYINKKSKILLGAYITRNSGYFNQTTTFMVPFINYSFAFGKL